MDSIWCFAPSSKSFVLTNCIFYFWTLHMRISIKKYLKVIRVILLILHIIIMYLRNSKNTQIAQFWVNTMYLYHIDVRYQDIMKKFPNIQTAEAGDIYWIFTGYIQNSQSIASTLLQYCMAILCRLDILMLLQYCSNITGQYCQYYRGILKQHYALSGYSISTGLIYQ